MNYLDLMGNRTFHAGYTFAILDMAASINNATKNGYRQHWDTDLLDQLLSLANENKCDLTTEEILDAE